jgi:hypothetical protein
MSEPVCTGCGGPRDRPRGAGWWPTCRRCHAAYQRTWRQERAELFRHLKRIIKNVSRETFDGASQSGAGKG